MTSALSLSRSQVERFIELFVPAVRELISCLRLSKEGDGLKPWFRECLSNLKIAPWAGLYEDPANEQKAAWLLMDSPAEVNKTLTELGSMSLEEQSDWLKQFIDDLLQAASEEVQEEEMIQEEFDALTEEERIKVVRDVQQFVTFLMPTMFNLFAKMVHGKSMYQLVAEAKGGNFQSFLDAIQIDKSAITAIPFFVDLNHRVADEGHLNIQRQIATYRNKPIFQSPIRYLTLWLVFAFLDDVMLLEQYEEDLEHFASLCQRLGLYGPPPDKDVVDLEAFQGRIEDYKRHRRHLVSRSMSARLVKDESLSKVHP